MRHNFQQRRPKLKEHIGHLIFFCEGSTEFNYVQIFADILNKHSDTTDVIVLQANVGSNAQRVLDYANEAMENEYRAYRNYTLCLLFDCDAPSDIQRLINDVLSSRYVYKIFVSNPIFELWLLMHFEQVSDKLSKKAIYEKLQEHLRIGLAEDWDKYKASKGMLLQILRDGSMQNACCNATELQSNYSSMNLHLNTDIEKMNPYTNMHELINSFSTELNDEIYAHELTQFMRHTVTKHNTSVTTSLFI